MKIMENREADSLLTLKEAADLSNVSKRTLYRIMQDEKFPRPIRIGRGLRIKPDELREYWDSQRVK